ncbi:NUDIX hydrolase [Thioalkalivibrio sp. HK1]|uniref:NUDIX hydrolase n=1 Tax=Thioalkalivibrio sp. HK1 TaxID=1469245 RepID=UPI000472231E|nr:NUDIX hydrolase [Thioalkalivibrio sp. HK1]
MSGSTVAESPAASRPRDAASLIVVRTGADGESECLMGRRRRSARFLPGYFVFPGGSVEKADFRARSASILDPSSIWAMGVGDRRSRAEALAMAAVRETWEETGVLIAEPGDVGSAPGPAFDEMRRLNLAPALGRLVYLGRAITPTFSAIRFHARFFLVRIDAESDPAGALSADPGDLCKDGELECLSWVRLSRVSDLETIRVTRFMTTFAARIIDEGLASHPYPVLYGRASKRLVRYLREGDASVIESFAARV